MVRGCAEILPLEQVRISSSLSLCWATLRVGLLQSQFCQQCLIDTLVLNRYIGTKAQQVRSIVIKLCLTFENIDSFQTRDYVCTDVILSLTSFLVCYQLLVKAVKLVKLNFSPKISFTKRISFVLPKFCLTLKAFQSQNLYKGTTFVYSKILPYTRTCLVPIFLHKILFCTKTAQNLTLVITSYF